MPEHLRALFIVLVITTAFFAFAHRTACSISGQKDFARRRNLWFVLTLAAFIAHNFWIYAIVAIPALVYSNRNESNPPALFFFVLFALPMAIIQIPGAGVINFLFDLTHARMLTLVILLPALLFRIRRSDSLPFGRTGSDKALAAYLLLAALLYLRGDSLTSDLRQTFYLFIDIFLPYFVISRSLKNIQTFKDALLSFVLAIMLLALFANFEFFKHWLLYQPMLTALGLEAGMTGYLARDNMLRVMASAGHPIVLGYLMVVAIGFYLFLQRSFQQKLVRRLGMALLVAGLLVPLSRGPWVGAAALLIVFIATGRSPVPRLMGLAVAGMLAVPLVAALPGGERVINLLPFIGTTEKGTLDYREDLITNSMIVIQRNPWFGSVNYFDTPEMEAMRQGQGIIDVVNTYLGVALNSGFVGLGLFVGFFTLTLLGIYRAMRSISDRGSEEYLLGRVLLATLLSILLMIFTVSGISYIPIVYWSVASMGLAYTQMVNRRNEMS